MNKESSNVRLLMIACVVLLVITTSSMHKASEYRALLRNQNFTTTYILRSEHERIVKQLNALILEHEKREQKRIQLFKQKMESQ